MKYVVTINDKDYEVEVETGKAVVTGLRSAAISDAMPVKATAAAQAGLVSDKQAAPAAVPAQGEMVKAPMPGTILDVKVSAGSKVKKGSVLLILEAMKMENEIVAPCDGSVSYINSARGSSINTGDLLVVIQ